MKRLLIVAMVGLASIAAVGGAIGNGHHGTISDTTWTASAIQLVSSSSFGRNDTTALDNAVPSALSPDGTSFTVAYRTAPDS